MTTATEIINSAFRENNIVAAGVTPTAAETAEALGILNNVMLSLFGRVVGCSLLTWEAGPAVTSPVYARYPVQPLNTTLRSNEWPYPPPNVQIQAAITGASTIWFPWQPTDGAQIRLVNVNSDFTTAPLTLDANGKLIEGALTKLIDAPLTAPYHWFYRADLADWLAITRLTADSELPFPDEYDDYFITAVNIRLCPRYAKQIREATSARFSEIRKMMKQQYFQQSIMATSPEGQLFNSRQVGFNNDFFWPDGPFR